ncbi:MAG: hypothetical protein JHC87_02775 [Thermoleophilaceae bacterium]|nr:hypothetical protein [Thermoleophilaceae bacterium]
MRRTTKSICSTMVVAAVIAAAGPATASAADAREALRVTAVNYLQQVKSGRFKGSMIVSRNGTSLITIGVDSKFDFSDKRYPRVSYTISRIGYGSGPAVVTLYKGRIYVKVVNGRFFGTTKDLGMQRLTAQLGAADQGAVVNMGLNLFSDFRDDGPAVVDGTAVNMYSALGDLDNLIEVVAPYFGIFLPNRVVDPLGIDTRAVKFIEQYVDGNLPRVSLGVDAAGLPRVTYINAQSNNGEYQLNSRFDFTGLNQPVNIKPLSKAKRVGSRKVMNKLIQKGLS